jgi:uncharacterized protein (TIGR03067 family)
MRPNCLRFPILCGLALVVGLSFADDREDSAKKDLKLLQGTWQLVSAENAGEDVTKDTVDRGMDKLIISSDAWIQETGGKPNYTARNSRITLDPSTTLKSFDHIVTLVDHSQRLRLIYPGIYELQGNTLKICFDVDLKSRPKEFKTKPGQNYFSAVLKKVEP